MIKNGIAYDKRYNEKKRFARPQELVFSNEFPALDMMSADRWEIAVMTADFDIEWIAREDMRMAAAINRSMTKKRKEISNGNDGGHFQAY